MTTQHTPRESYWRGHWAAIDGWAVATERDDAEAFARGAERGAAALAKAAEKPPMEQWAWIYSYCEGLDAPRFWNAGAYADGVIAGGRADKESDR